MNTTDILRFALTTTRAGLFFTPVNDAAKATLPDGRKCLLRHEVTALLVDERVVEVDLNPFVGVHHWVALTPSSLADA